VLHFWDCLDVEAIRAMQPGLRANRTLRELCLAFCDLDEERLRLLADALVGNTSLDVLDLYGNQQFTSNGAADVTRLVQFTQLKNIDAAGNSSLFADKDAVESFISVLQQHNTSLEQFYGLYSGDDAENASQPHR
jgi:hypothetical protein